MEEKYFTWRLTYIYEYLRERFLCFYGYDLDYEYYRGTDKSLARPTSRYILFDGENISFDASLVIYI